MHDAPAATSEYFMACLRMASVGSGEAVTNTLQSRTRGDAGRRARRLTNVGAVQLADYFQECEQWSAAGELDHVADKMAVIRRNFDLVLAELNSELELESA